MDDLSRLLFRSCLLVLLAFLAGLRSGVASATPPIAVGSAATIPSVSFSVLITAIYFDPFVTGEGSEAIQIQNIGRSAASIGDWKLSDDHGAVLFPAGSMIGPGQKLWASKSAAAFRVDFGSPPDFEYGGNSDPVVPDMTGSALDMGNSGEVLMLKDERGEQVDTVSYGDASPDSPFWLGSGVRPYSISGGGTEGQILYHKMSESDGLPITDTNSSSNWAQDPADPSLGRRVLFPGWDLDRFLMPVKVTEHAHIKYCVAPDNLFVCYRDEIIAAATSVRIDAYSLNNARLVDALVDRLAAGVQVSALIDSGAMDDQGRWACQQIESRGGQCWLMDSRPQSKIPRRYDNLHGKWTLFDGKRLFVSSENLGSDGMPSDDKRDGTSGTRGAGLLTDSPTLVARAEDILDSDLDPSSHRDIRRWGSDADDFPPLEFAPNYADGGTTYPAKFPAPFTAEGTFSFELVQCPENCLFQNDSLLGLVGRAGPGDSLLVEQLYERTFWGRGKSNPALDPNIRLEAYLSAARRGAHVRILLDSFFDNFSDTRSNYETCRYVNRLSSYYSIECRLGNPTGLGMHNKMVLLDHAPTGFVHVGSINGSETSSKLNRELAIQLESRQAYSYWASVFDYDWSVSKLFPTQIYLPLLLGQ